jgi:uncharacterized protein (TIGR02302 family)
MKKESEASGSSPTKTNLAPMPEERLLEGKVRSANRALIFEKLWPRVWLPLSIAGVFVLLSALEIWQYLPPRLHFGLLCGFAAALVLSLFPLFVWRKPDREKSFARLEQASALDHRPLTAFNDTLTQENPSRETDALWQAHRTRAAQALKKLKAGAPHPRIDKYDPFALRASLILMLLAVISWSWNDLGSRLHAAFIVPDAPAGSGFRIDAWISPPPYTRKEPFVLPAASPSPVAVPQGSVLTVKINAPDAAGYRVALSGGAETQTLDPAGQSSGNYAEYIQKIEHSGTLSVRHGFGSERSWTLTATPDKPPAISFVGPVEVSPRGVMLFKYKVEDDYGVASAEARIERIQTPPNGSAGAEGQPQIGKPPVFPLSLPHSPVKAGDGKTYRDLTSHPWAGLPAVITLTAKDEAGQEGHSAPRGLILPERKFTKPLAKAVIGQRRALVEDPADTFRIANNLNALAISAEDDNIAPSIYLNMRSAYWRLRAKHTSEDVENVVDQLWDAAIRIEDGNLSSAERDLRAAQERLKDALERGAPPEEIQKLMAELRKALSQYLQALMQQKGKNGQSAVAPNAKTVSPQDLEKLLNKIESLAKAGSPEAAAQMLNQLRDILESLQAGGQSNSASSQEDAEKMKQLDRLGDIMRQQQQLLDQTFRAQQGGGTEQEQGAQRGGQGQKQRGRSQNGSEGAGGLKQRQDAIQKQLQDLLSGMRPGGESIQRKLEEAEGAMGEAGDALQQQDLGEAGDDESHALEAMRQGARGLAEQLMQSQGTAGGNGTGTANRDPLGRLQGNQLTDPGDSVKVPDEITVQRARQILDELRRRLGEPARPPIELDYLERLVKPY